MVPSVHVEIAARGAALAAAWNAHGRFWTAAGVNFGQKRSVFRSAVQGAALAALEAYVIPAASLAKLDRELTKRARVLLRGKACKKISKSTGLLLEHPGDAEVRYVKHSNAQVWKQIRCLPCAPELRLRRLKWMQAVARHPEQHRQHLAALLGRLHHTEEPPTLDEHGAPTAQANPWLQQLCADVGSLAGTDEGDDLLALVGSCVLRLFTEHREKFAALDLQQYRAREWCRMVPPPGLCCDPLSPSLEARKRRATSSSLREKKELTRAPRCVCVCVCMHACMSVSQVHV